MVCFVFATAIFTAPYIRSFVVIVLLSFAFLTGKAQTAYSISSPDKKTVYQVEGSKDGPLKYRVLYKGKEAISWSALGLKVEEGSANNPGSIKVGPQKKVNTRFAWPLGENDLIVNNYTEGSITCQKAAIVYILRIRVYDGSVAFRYEVPQQPVLQESKIMEETTTFQFTTNCTLYQYNQESVFKPVGIDTFSNSCDFPATLTNGQLFFSIGEANNTGYTKAELKRGQEPHSLSVAFMRDKNVEFYNQDFTTPWRTISIAEKAIGLHAFSELNLKLTEPTAQTVPAWIKPGKLIRAQLTTQAGLDCIDFAATHNFQYIMFDAGWYGAEFRSTSDPTQVIPAIDMPQVIQHGKEKGIGVILYVNYVGLRAKLDTILPLFKKWGVSGMKFGFVDGLTQKGLLWLAGAIKKVNEYGFILDIHDNYKPTGLSRTFPALLTQEGIRGDENSPDAFHTTVLPFTRFLAGPADFTFCFPNATNSYSKNLKVSKAQQFALTVVYCSPLQSIFWYGRPGDYTNEEEIEFFKLVPTVWNESHYLTGDIGKNISVARRKGNTWFVGNAAGLTDWQETITLDFLTPHKKYTATVYEDDEQGGIRKRKIAVQKGDRFTIAVKAAGGQALVIE